MAVFDEKYDFEAEESIEYATGSRRHSHCVGQTRKHMGVYHRQEYCKGESPPPIVPLTEIPIDLDAYQVQHHMTDITVEKGTDENTPQFVVIP